MTQRIFDIDNEEDMALLWSILPDNIEKVKQKFADGSGIVYVTKTGSCVFDEMKIININWNNKTEITRPIQEATEADIGKLCKFWTGKDYTVGILNKIDNDNFSLDIYYMEDGKTGIGFVHCRRLTKQEIEELC